MQFESTAKRLVVKKQRYGGDPVTISASHYISTGHNDDRVAMTLTQEARHIVDRVGKTVATDRQRTQRLVATLLWTNGQWRVKSIQVI